MSEVEVKIEWFVCVCEGGCIYMFIILVGAITGLLSMLHPQQVPRA